MWHLCQKPKKSQQKHIMLEGSKQNPPTPPGSTGCEIVSGSPLLSPRCRIQVVLWSPPPVAELICSDVIDFDLIDLINLIDVAFVSKT